MMTAQEIAIALGGGYAQQLPNGSYLTRCPLPSHGKGRGDHSPSLSLRDGDHCLLVHCFAGCDPCDILDAIHDNGGELDHPGAAPAPKEDDYKRQQHGKALRLWRQRRPIAGTIAERYLREVRGITCALPGTLGFLPARKPEHHPAMIAAFALADETPRPLVAVHLTLLKPDGSGKAEIEKPKIMVGSPSGLPIVVALPNDLLGLAICEGIEDALTAHQLTGLGAWAAGAAGFMGALGPALPDYIEAVTIFAHADKAGQDGAHELLTALRQRRIETVVEGLL
jgi:Toprim domain